MQLSVYECNSLETQFDNNVLGFDFIFTID